MIFFASFLFFGLGTSPIEGGIVVRLRNDRCGGPTGPFRGLKGLIVECLHEVQKPPDQAFWPNDRVLNVTII